MPRSPNPGAFSPGQTTVVPQSDVAVEEQGGNHMFLFNPGVSLDEVVKAVNEGGCRTQ